MLLYIHVDVLNVHTVTWFDQELLCRRPFPGKRFLHLHIGLQVQWWLMMSTTVLTSARHVFAFAQKKLHALLFIVLCRTRISCI